MKIRPYVTGAILRNIKLDQARYNSFIALQDKLHQNLARQRTLASVGTHDLDTIQGPFTYEALPPEKISFVPLNQTKEMNGRQLMDFYKNDPHLGRYLPIIKDSPVYPVIYDANHVVCSLPPIINSDHSKITVDTRNIFIEVTATDKTKVEVVVNTLVTMFSEYCKEPFTVEPVNVISKHNNESRQVPDLTPRETVAELSFLNSCCGLNLPPQEICRLLGLMALTASPSKSSKDLIDVSVPPTRADILHQCDIMEDLAIAYGFNRLPRKVPMDSYTVAQPLRINKLTDILRETAASSGWVEVLPLILCSHEVCFEWLNRKDDGKTAVRLANPKSAEYQIVRTTLIPGLLMSIRENRGHTLPIQIFESSDVVFKDTTQERQTRNERRFAAAFCGTKSGFEVVHGLLGRIMTILKCEFAGDVEKHPKKESINVYWIEKTDGEIDVVSLGPN
jgi:phenylalanyl-tRNA synthetase beta chain